MTNQTVIIHNNTPNGVDAHINITPLASGNTPEVFRTEGQNLACLLWALLPDETMEALTTQIGLLWEEKEKMERARFWEDRPGRVTPADAGEVSDAN